MIGGIFLTVVTAIILTLYLTLQKPLEYDHYFGGDYNYVKENYDQIVRDSNIFDTRYSIAPPEKPEQGANQLKISIVSKQDATPVANAEIRALFTRPATNAQDIALGTLEYSGGVYSSESFEIWAKGTWILELSIDIDNLKAHRSFEFEYPEN